MSVIAQTTAAMMMSVVVMGSFLKFAGMKGPHGVKSAFGLYSLVIVRWDDGGGLDNEARKTKFV